MSKADTLLKKATFFERMALYSDRKSFLQALAQQEVDPKLRPYGGSKNTMSDTWEQARKEEFGNARTIPAPDPSLAEPFGPSLTGGESHNYGPQSPQSNIADYPAQKSQSLAPIDPKVQEHLSSLVTNRKWGIPLRPINGKTPFDGRIGPDTQRALDAFKSNMRMPASTPNAQIFQAIEAEYAKDNQPSYNFDAQVQQKEQNRIRESTPPGIGVNAPKNT